MPCQLHECTLLFQVTTDRVSYLFFVAHTLMAMLIQPATLLGGTTASKFQSI
jgi:hypothetical protein